MNITFFSHHSIQSIPFNRKLILLNFIENSLNGFRSIQTNIPLLEYGGALPILNHLIDFADLNFLKLAESTSHFN